MSIQDLMIEIRAASLEWLNGSLSMSDASKIIEHWKGLYNDSNA